MLLRVSAIPFVFFGWGSIARLATFFRYDAFPTISVFDYFLFEGAIGIVSLALAFAARRVTPLWANRTAVLLTGACMVGGSALIVLACFVVPLPAPQGGRPAGGGRRPRVAHPHVGRVLRLAQPHAVWRCTMPWPSSWAKW